MLVGGGILAGLKALDDQVSRVKTSVDEAANAMRNVGGSLDVDRIRSFVQELAQGSAAGVASLTDLYNAVQTLGRHVKNTDQLERALSDTVQLAAHTHADFGTAVNWVQRGLSGYLVSLTRAGILHRDEAAHIKTVEQLMELLEKKTHGATDKIDEHTKAWGRVRNAWQQAALDLGQILGPAILWIINTIDSMARSADAMLKSIAAAVHTVTILWKYEWASLLDWIHNVFLPGLAAVGELLLGVLTHNASAIGDALGKIKNGWHSTMADIADVTQVAVATINTSLKSILFPDLGLEGKKGQPGFGGDAHFEGGTGKKGAGSKKGTGNKQTLNPGEGTNQFIISDTIGDVTPLTAPSFHQPQKSETSADRAIQFAPQIEQAQSRIDDLTQEMDLLRISGKLTVDQQDKYNIKIAEAQVRLAALNAIIQNTEAANQALLKAQRDLALAQAQNEADVKRLSLGHRLLDTALGQTYQQFKSLLTGLNPFQAAIAIAAEHSRAFQAIAEILGNLFVVLARVLDAILLPVVLTLNRVLTFVVNIFIDLWNAIAAILNAMGLHVKMLEHINSLLGNIDSNARPLIDIIHDLPTLKEQGAGKWGPLEPDQYGNNAGIFVGLTGPLNQHTTLLQRIVGLLGLILVVDWLTHSKFIAGIAEWITRLWTEIGQFFHGNTQEIQKGLSGAGHIALGIGLLSVHAQGIMGWLARILGVLQIVQGILAIIQALTATKTFIPFLCPEVNQLIETQERGFVRAGDLRVGEHLRDPIDDEWNEIFDLAIRSTLVVRFVTDVEAISVNYDHAVWDEHGEWVPVRDLGPGDKIMGYPSGLLTVKSVDFLGAGKYAAINCARHRYVLGKSVGHNDSGDIGAFIAHSLSAAANRVSGLTTAFAGSVRRVSPGFRTVGTSTAANNTSDNSTSITQYVTIGEVHGVNDLGQIADRLSSDADRLLRTRAYAVGNFT